MFCKNCGTRLIQISAQQQHDAKYWLGLGNKSGIPENKNKKICQKCFSEIKNQNSIFCTKCGANLLEREYPAVFDENLIRVRRAENIQNFPEVISSKGISESGYQQRKTENVIMSQESHTQPTSESIHWAGAGQSIVVHGYTIENPFTYWCDGSSSPQEAHCIDRTISVGNPDNADSHDLPYWLPYSRLTPDQRARYLSWLSHGRTEELDQIGYAIFFLYGLERRAIIEKKDIEDILSEVCRLLSRYSASKLLSQYFNNFIDYVVAGRLNEIDELTIKKFFLSFADLDDNSLMTFLAWHGMNDKKVSWELAYSIANVSQKTSKT